MRIFTLILSTTLFWGCATTTTNNEVQIEDNDQIAVCGEVAGEKQTYPTLGDLKADGAKVLYYGPCYND
jgi:hypothetical protein